ncbi:MAG: hydroxyethylthiazole kinase, partial [Firmicutes bacterium]|nr:hydroxyethylthiazole kinase [Bacillota bacterium]
DEQDAVEVAQQLAERLHCVVAVTGKTDIITNGRQVYAIQNGHPIMANVTGTGCMATSLTGSCCGAATEDIIGAAAGILIMGLAGERAYASLQGEESVGTFHARLFDEVYNMTADKILQGGKIAQIC